MNKIRDIIRLHQTSNLLKRKISRALNISRPAVDHYLKRTAEAQLQWTEVKDIDDKELLQRLERSEENSNDPLYMELKLLLPDIAKELGKKHVTRQLLWEEYRTADTDTKTGIEREVELFSSVFPARPRKPKDKTLVEAAVYVVYTRVLAPLRTPKFGTLGELNTAISSRMATTTASHIATAKRKSGSPILPMRWKYI